MIINLWHSSMYYLYIDDQLLCLNFEMVTALVVASCCCCIQ